MMVETQLHGSRSAIGQRLVYIQYITSAPWNRKEIQRPPRYKGVGTALLRYARLRSVELGYGGRIGLHSLPTAERFYENQNMLNLGIDEEYENLTYFEFQDRIYHPTNFFGIKSSFDYTIKLLRKDINDELFQKFKQEMIFIMIIDTDYNTQKNIYQDILNCL